MPAADRITKPPEFNFDCVPQLVETCGSKFRKFRTCHDRVTKETLTSDPELLAIKEALKTAQPASTTHQGGQPYTSPENASREALLSRGNHILARRVFEDCSYIQTPLKECIAEVACLKERQLRDEVFGMGDTINEGQKRTLMEFDADFQQCLRVFQVKMDVAMKATDGKVAE